MYCLYYAARAFIATGTAKGNTVCSVMKRDMGTEQLQERAGRLVRFVTRDIWLQDMEKARGRRRGILGVLRWLYLVVHGFVADQCLLRASALTYTTVLSIVPTLAVAFSISKGLGIQNTEFIRVLLMRIAAGREDTVTQILAYVDNTNVKTLGAVGLLALFVTVGSLMGTIEKAFNSIWGVARGRTLWRKFTDFFSVTLVCPIVMAAAFSFSVSLRHETLVQKLLNVGIVSYAYVAFLKMVPFLMIALMLFFIYVFIPNTRVRFGSALLGGLVAGLLWTLAEGAYVGYQIGAARYNAIYGGFAQLPLFLIWVYVTWVIVLLGAEVSFAVQNVRTFESEIRADTASREERDKLAVLVMLALTRAFYATAGPVPLDRLCMVARAPVRLVQDTLAAMERVSLVVGTEGDDPRYALTAPPESIRVMDILLALASHKVTGDRPPVTEDFPFVDAVFRRFYEASAASTGNLSLKEFHDGHLPDSFAAELVLPERGSVVQGG